MSLLNHKKVRSNGQQVCKSGLEMDKRIEKSLAGKDERCFVLMWDVHDIVQCTRVCSAEISPTMW